MDVDALMQIVNANAILLIPIILGITEIVKRLLSESVATKWAPIISLIIAIVSAVMVIGVTRQALVAGVVMGLSASGLWSSLKSAIFEKKTN
jgi:hypothetical protein